MNDYQSVVRFWAPLRPRRSSWPPPYPLLTPPLPPPDPLQEAIVLEREAVTALRRQQYEYLALVERERQNIHHPPASTIYSGLPRVNFTVQEHVSTCRHDDT